MSPGISCCASGTSLRLNSQNCRHLVERLVTISGSFTDTREHAVTSVRQRKVATQFRWSRRHTFFRMR